MVAEDADVLDTNLHQGPSPVRSVKHQHILRVDKRIPCTDIPIRHFYAMLKKDYLLWVRTWRRMLFEIAFPALIFVVLAVIRDNIPREVV